MDKFQESHNAHAVLTQYYRWYQVYEVPFTKSRIDNQKDILTDDVEIVTSAGTSNGKANLEERLKVYEGWQNAHHVKSTAVKLLDSTTLSLEADILYQNIRPDNSRYSYTIHYSMLLEIRRDNLPLFKHISLQPTGTIENPQFVSAYAENRAKSFMHYWLLCIETANGNSAPFKELLAGEFELHLGDDVLTDTFEKFNDWIVLFSKRVKVSRHILKSFSAKMNNDRTISVSLDFEWNGVTTDDNKEKTAQTHHEWVLSNDMDQRFARMKKMQVTFR